MTRFLLSILFVSCLIFTYLFYLSQQDVAVVPSHLEARQNQQFHSYRGVLSVRSNRSNGSASPDFILEEARASGLDWIILTDPQSNEEWADVSGYRGKLLVVDAEEISALDSRYLLIESVVGNRKRNSSKSLLRLTELLSKKTPDPEAITILSAASFRNWKNDLPLGLHGFELYNSRSLGADAWSRAKVNVFVSLLDYIANPRYGFLRLYSEPVDSLQMWEGLLESRSFAAVASVDANARALPLPNWILSFPSYARSFETFSTNVWVSSELTGNYAKDRSKILQAISNGQSYLCLELLGECRDFTTYLEEDQKKLLPGHRGKWKKGMQLHVHLQQEPNSFFELLIFRNGEKVMTVNQKDAVFPVLTPGVYRVTVRVIPTLPFPEGKKWYTWITSNAFVLQ